MPSPCSGPPLPATPGAWRPANRYDVLVVAGGDGTISEAADGLNGARLPSCRSYQIVSCDKVEIGGGSDEPVQGDGDIIAKLDVTIEVVTRAINLIYLVSTPVPRHATDGIGRAP